MIIYNKSCKNLEEIKDESVDLVITSPPYKDNDGYSIDLMKNISENIYRVLKNDSLVFVNFGHLAGMKSRPLHVCMEFEKHFDHTETIIWVKSSQYTGGHFRPINSDYLLNNMWEYIFMFSKGKAKLDRKSIGIPYMDKTNIKRFNHKNDIRCAGNVWYIPYETVNTYKLKNHKDMFPKEIPRRCIKLSGIQKGSCVLDPFSGSGTTLRVATEMGMNAIGYEINKKYFDISKNLFEETLK